MSEPEQPPRAGNGLSIVLGCLGALVLTGGAYWLALWLSGLSSSGAVGTGHLVGGFAVTLFIMGLFAILGETIIEDVVKLVIIYGLAFASWSQFGDGVRAVLMGLPLGATLIVARHLFAGR